MGFADFLAQVGGGTGIGAVGRAFGGESEAEKTLRPFVQIELPAMMEKLRQTTDPQAGRDLLGTIYQKAAAAGVGPRSMENLHNILQKPFMDNMAQRQLGQLLQEYGPQPAQPRPEGTEGPLTQAGNFIDPSQGKPPDFSFGMRMGQALGANPEGYKTLLEMPGTIGEKEAKRKQEEQKYQGIENAPDVEIPGMGGMTIRDYARMTGGQVSPYAVAVTPQREKPLDPLEMQRAAQLEASTKALLHAANAPYPGQEAKGSTEYQDYIKLGGTPNDMAQFQQYLEQRRGAGKPAREARTDAQVQQEYINAVAKRDQVTRNPLVGSVLGEREAYGALDAQVKQLETEMRQRGMLAPTAPTPTPQPTTPRPKGPTPPQAAAPAGAPAIGSISKGYRFKGGDPSKRENWEPVR